MFVYGQMKEVVDTLKDDAPRLDSILMHMGSMYSTLGNFEKSLDTYQRAIYIMKRTFGECIFLAKFLESKMLMLMLCHQ